MTAFSLVVYLWYVPGHAWPCINNGNTKGKNGLELEPVDNNGAGLELELESVTLSSSRPAPLFYTNIKVP